MKVLVFPICLILSTQCFAANEHTDPTRPLTWVATSASQQQGDLRLGSIIVVNGVSSAFINGKKMLVGDTVGQYQLLTIDKSYVVLGKNGEHFKLNLFTQPVVKNDEK